MGGALGRADGSTLVAGKHAGAVTDTHVAAYAVFEKSANEDLERSVGGVIERTLRAALPGAQAGNDALKGRLVNSIRQDVEKALQGDRELGERVRQILSGRRLDNATRAQVVRVIGERAEQLVPGAAKKILSDWTQTTVASHRERSGRAAEAASRTEVATVAVDRENGERARAKESARDGKQRGVDYRKVTDEQILAM